MKNRFHLIAPVLCPVLGTGNAASLLEHPGIDVGYQLYQEDAERIRVESWYLRGNIDVVEGSVFRFQMLQDTITGASPTGLQAESGRFLTNLTDTRKGLMAALDQQFGDHTVSLELSRSEEDDYLSYGYALSDKWELNQKNTTLSLGINYLDDDVSVTGIAPQRKEGIDFFVGVSQLLDKNTVLTCNLTLGYNNGYLNDPYKLVQRSETTQIDDGFGGVIDVPVIGAYAENRPDSRNRQVLQLGATRYVESAHAALDTTLRLASDDYGVFSQSLQLEWRQTLGKGFTLVPFIRYYHQSAADFFVNSLDSVLPFPQPLPDYPNGSSPNYSADYRLSGLESTSCGLRLLYEFNEVFSASVSYERYAMEGSGNDVAAAAAYPSADIWTVGLRARF